jgi:phosphatidylethanolamine-binding protein (PEBP) family uncharacterized protein
MTFAKLVSFFALCSLLFILGVVANHSNQAMAAGSSLEVAFEFTPENLGPNGPSPAITVKNIPAEAARLKVDLKDLDSRSFKHGGGEVSVNPGTSEAVIPSGALTKQYKGPFPPRGKVHRYVFTVTAIGADGAKLATGEAQRTFKGI